MEMMMMVMMTMVMCVRVSLLKTTAAAASLHGHQVQASHGLVYDHRQLFTSLSRKLMLQKRVEGYGVQDLASYNDQKEPQSGESKKKEEEEEGVAYAANGSNPTHFFTMDYSHVRRRRPIHNKSFPRTSTSP